MADPVTGQIAQMNFGDFGTLEVERAALHRFGSRDQPKGRDLVFLQARQGFFLVSQSWWETQPYPFILVAEFEGASAKRDFFDEILPYLRTLLRKEGLARIEKPEKIEVYQRGLTAVQPSAFEQFRVEP